MLTGVQNLDADFMSLRRSDLDLFDLERFAGTPADSSLALNRFSSSVRHGSGSRASEKGLQPLRRPSYCSAIGKISFPWTYDPIGFTQLSSHHIPVSYVR